MVTLSMPRGRPRTKNLVVVPPGENAPVKEKKSLIEDYEELKKVADADADGLKPKEAVFCRLIAEGGYAQKHAYIEAFQPDKNKVSDRSIIEISSRLANKPSIQHEIQRIKTEIMEESMSRQNRLMFALDGRKVAERMSIELYAMTTSADIDPKTKLRAIELLGKMRHVDAFVSSTSVNTQIVNGNLGIDTNATASEAKKTFAASIQKRIEARKTENEVK